ncbi:sigma-54-dependent transcriptional regulator [Methylobrevis albus]|uniref:Sigma-54-dependent Fis family transcriptional regulator n=1 Tax=Methylobrevis albus TaxID=2793297 RepID=A0A931MZX4_9HYPH|nr:sigma-54 dependent transcriptional regulator [Methylobrevis albus]MBH0239470.1 sigma-54-dependent Fis family transcriptional regulator [Methylobrevis albus]
MPPVSVLVVDDDAMVRDSLAEFLGLSGFAVSTAADAAEGLGMAIAGDPDVVLTDVRMPGRSGLEFLRALRAACPEAAVVLITGHGDVPMAVEAVKGGAFEFLQKPYDPDHLASVLTTAAEQRRLKRELAQLRRRLDGGEAELETRVLGISPAAAELRRAILELSPIAVDVVINGETGTGKEVAARALHALSPRRAGPFVAVNCAAIPSELVESELFGHEAGAFTGARATRIGKFEHANGGTLLLDEIESMPALVQAKVLRVLQERVVERVGSNRPIVLDVRILAASKADLGAESGSGGFRADLYYRLNTASLALPPLRERGEDVPFLFEHFLTEAARRHGREPPPVRTDDVEALLAHDWPGNLRELKSVAERFALGLSASGSVARILRRGQPPTAASASLAERVASYERRLIEAALAEHGGSVQAVVETLKVPRRTLNEKMAKYGLVRPRS